MFWYKIRQKWDRTARAVGNWYHGSLPDRALARAGRLARAPLDWALRMIAQASDFLDAFTVFDRPVAARATGKWAARFRRLAALPLVGRLLRVLMWPLAMAARLLGGISRGAEAVITAETPSLVPDAVARKQAQWVIALRAWWVRHDLGTWMKASPALAALGAWLFLAALALWQTPARVKAKYTTWAEDAQKSGNFPRARVASERLIQLGGTNQPANVLRLAKSLAGMGFMDESLALADTVASQATGYLPARLFIAEAIVSNPGANSNALRSAEQHLLRAYKADPNSADVQVLLGRFYYRVGDWEEAKWHLKRAFHSRRDAALTLAAMELNLRNELAAVRWAAEAAAHYKAATVDNPRHWRNRLFWAEAELIRGNITNSLDILQEGIQRGDVKIFHRMSAGIYADLLKRSLATDPTNIVEHLKLVEKGLGHDALNEFMLQFAVRLTHAAPVAEQARTLLRQLAQAKANRALINFFQGMDAFMRNDVNQARIFFDAAFVADSDNAIIANNYAWTLAISEPPDPSRSLRLINEVIEKYPQAPIFRETRGQIYARMGQWTNAVTDLETALPYFRSNAVFHASLAKVYSQIGRSDLSAEHQRMAETLKAAAAQK